MRSCRNTRSRPSASCTARCSRFSFFRNTQVSRRKAAPPGIRTRANSGSSAMMIARALTIFAAIPASPGRISVYPSATTTVSLVSRFIHSPEWTALTAR